MAGRILDSSIEEVKQRADIADIIGDYVKLIPSGSGIFKGLCPFHSEKTPSFSVNSTEGFYHCFGCGEGGSAFTFLMKYLSMSFPEAVEFAANKAGVTLKYDESYSKNKQFDGPKISRSEIVEINKRASEFFVTNLHNNSQDAQSALQILTNRDFTIDEIKEYEIGLAPSGWSDLINYLTKMGFSRELMREAGLTSNSAIATQNNDFNKEFDKFRYRLMWPIKDIAGGIVGFSGREVPDLNAKYSKGDFKAGKYINTSKTAFFNKSALLYSLDTAKKAISDKSEVIIVEGQTDVMAMQLEGYPNTVAACGTAFGEGHIKIIRRLLGDGLVENSEIIFFFDGDGAGQKAALKSYDFDYLWMSKSSVIISNEGMDPCELRKLDKNVTLNKLYETRVPLFEFKIKNTIEKFQPLNSIEKKSTAYNACKLVIAQIKDPLVLESYRQNVIKWCEIEPDLAKHLDEIKQDLKSTARFYDDVQDNSPKQSTNFDANPYDYPVPPEDMVPPPDYVPPPQQEPPYQEPPYQDPPDQQDPTDTPQDQTQHQKQSNPFFDHLTNLFAVLVQYNDKIDLQFAKFFDKLDITIFDTVPLCKQLFSNILTVGGLENYTKLQGDDLTNALNNQLTDDEIGRVNNLKNKVLPIKNEDKITEYSNELIKNSIIYMLENIESKKLDIEINNNSKDAIIKKVEIVQTIKELKKLK
ncbi:MAG: DNA primase, partial [Bifidobacteriaceae bacterium]|nr:DNA primase [Bifidobacteriaceae bacterium]